MKLVVSNIAWRKDEEPAVAELLKSLGVKYLEIAPTKQWEDPTTASDAELEAYSEWWRGYDIEIVAFQSMLFNRPDLKILQSDSDRAEALKYLQDFIVVAKKMGAQNMVFGSPKNRQRIDISTEDAQAMAIEFFSALGDVAKDNGVTFCIEPNAPQYACDFITSAQEGIDIVTAVNNDGFGLHLDIACMTLANDDIEKSIIDAADVLKHFHISAPMLGDVTDSADIDHRLAAKALRSIGYDRFVSIEMRPSDGDNLPRVKEAVEFAQNIYSS